MIDIHCHILPGVDDGAHDTDESVAMLEQAGEGGTRAVVATPHSDLRYVFDPVRCQDMIAELRSRTPDRPRIYLGCEVHLTPENITKVIRDPARYALNGGDCILLELPDRVGPPMVDPAIDALTGAGLRVIIAHPERNQYIQQQRSYLDRLVQSGCYLQVTARSLDGGFGTDAASTAGYILKQRLAHFVASDAHGASARRPGLAAAFDAVRRTYGEAAARTLLVSNPEAAIGGSAIQDMPMTPGWFNSLFTRSMNGLRKQTTAPLS